MLQEESDNIYGYGCDMSENFSRPRLKTEMNNKHSVSTNLKTVKKQLVSYSSERISQVSKRLAIPKNAPDK